ncbi:serine hydrolase [Sphingomonas sp.]|uniref:serine hydrolase domain-containing protein n=1 Tax=Sphingomonas sp. TaxID=28214 RepID=UPI001D5CB028|nr:serine hydrolase domain-containing protein [Sphingomonas sp.]MBX9797330.1 beta-lactamase family protein [Sphingomonas sp.]
MTKHRIILGSAMIALAATGALAGQAKRKPVVTRAAATAPAALTQSQALVKSYVDTHKVPGIVAAIGQGNAPARLLSAGTLSFDAGAPAADGGSLWRVYSMTKPVTAMAAMMLIEDGKLKLDQPVSDFIPAFKNMTVLVDPAKDLTAVPAKTPITVRHLLTHTAGLGYTIITTGPLLKEYEKNGIVPFTSTAAVEQAARVVRPKTLQEFANRVATLPLIAEPGTKWSYSISLDVLGAVIEKASGMPFDTFLQTRIFTPLKMDSTYFTVPKDAAARLVTGYTFFGANPVPIDPGATSVFLQPPSFPYGGAGLVMSASDYDRFLHMLQNGGTLGGVRVMKRETVAMAMSNLLPTGVAYKDSSAKVPMGFGAGGSVTLADTPGGPGKGTYGWGGAAGTIAWVDPARRQRVTVMVNYIPAGQWPLRTDFMKAFYADTAK